MNPKSIKAGMFFLLSVISLSVIGSGWLTLAFLDVLPNGLPSILKPKGSGGYLFPYQPMVEFTFFTSILVGLCYDFNKTHLRSLRWMIRLGLVGILVVEASLLQESSEWVVVQQLSYGFYIIFALLAECFRSNRTGAKKPLITFFATAALIISILMVVESERRNSRENNEGSRDTNSLSNSSPPNGNRTTTSDAKSKLPVADKVNLPVNPAAFIVCVHNASDDSSASGVVIDLNAGEVIVLTAAHILNANPELSIDFFGRFESDPVRTVSDVQIVASNSFDDLALLQVSAKNWSNLKPLPIGTQSDPESTESVISVGCTSGGYPSSLIGTATQTKVRLTNDADPRIVWEFRPKPRRSPGIGSVDMEGRSGGALISKSGKLIGIASGINGEDAYFAHRSVMVQFLKENGARVDR